MTLVTSGAMGTFVTKNVGTGITVIVSGLSLYRSRCGQLQLERADDTADITPAALQVTGITAMSKTYDGKTTATLDTSAATLVGVTRRTR